MTLSAAIRLLAVVALVAGCGQEPGTQFLRRWELVSEGHAAQVELPARLDRQVRGPSYQLRRGVFVTRGSHLELLVPALDARAVLVVDGLRVEPDGGLPRSGYRSPGPHRYLVPAEASADGYLDLVLRVEHTWTQSAWWNAAPRLLPQGGFDLLSVCVELFNRWCAIAALMALLQTAIITALPYFVDRKRREYLLFGGQALIALVYPLYMSGLLQHVVGALDTNVLAIGLIVATGLSVHFTHAFFAAPPPSPWFARLAVACALPSLVVLDPMIFTRIAGVPTIGYVTAVAVYQLWFCARLWLGNPERRASLWIFLSWLLLTLTCVPDFLGWLALAEPLHGIRLASLGLVCFGVFLSMLFAQRHTLSLLVSDEKGAELAARVVQMKQLNEELRRQVEEKSSQIYAALALARGAPSEAPELAPGTVLEGRYRVERRIGAGGMGDVYEITRLTDGKRLALKLAREVSGVALARLAREAQVACKVTHENVVALLDVDVATAGFLYIVMELVPGEPLDPTQAARRGPAWAIEVLRQIAEGLAALHAAGVVHRDLKPGNVLVSEERGVAHVKISDFGIALPAEALVPRRTVPTIDGTPAALLAAVEPQAAAPGLGDPTEPDAPATKATRVLSGGPPLPPMPMRTGDSGPRSSSPLTGTGLVPGTPAYIAPELLLGREHVSPAADMFAFGIMAYELFAGGRPFAEPPVQAMLAGRGLAAAVPLRLDGLPAEVARLCEDCVSFRPESRPSAREVAERLARVLTSLARA